MALVSLSHRNDRIRHDIVLATVLTFWPSNLSQLLVLLVDFGASGLCDAEQLASSDHHLQHLKGVLVSGQSAFLL